MANRNAFQVLAIPLTAAVLIFGFQNCAPGFKSLDSASESLVDLSVSSEVPVGIVDATGKPFADGEDLIVDVEYTARIVGTRIPDGAVVTWTATASPGAAVHVHPGADQTISQLHCEASGLIYFSVQVVADGTTYNSKQMTLPCSDAPVVGPTPPPVANPTIVVFRIPAGTNTSPWNTLATAVNVKVGQTLRIINDDSIVHRLHTGGAPCPHQPANSAPGATFDCVVTRTINAANGGTYDHNIGTNARFYINSTP